MRATESPGVGLDRPAGAATMPSTDGPGSVPPEPGEVNTVITSGSGMDAAALASGDGRAEAAFDEVLAAAPAPDAAMAEWGRQMEPGRRTRRLLKVAIGITTAVIVLVLGSLGYLAWQVSRIDRINTYGALDRIGGGLKVDATPAEGGSEQRCDGLVIDDRSPCTTDTSAEDGAATDGSTLPATTLAPPPSSATAATGTGVATAPARPGTTIAVPVITVPNDAAPAAPASTVSEEGVFVADPTDTAPPETLPNKALVALTGAQPVGSDKAFNLLVLGTDSRDGLTGDSAKDAGKGKVSGNRPDSLMLLRIDPEAHQAWALSIPRDLWVRVDGTGKWDRINGAFSGKQPAKRLINTIRSNLSIPVHHVISANFAGFQKMVATLDGVDICFNLPSRDVWTGLNQGQGCNHLDPRQALAFGRSRHFEEFRNGKWVPDGKGDFARMKRQQAFLRATMARAISQGAGNPLTLNALLANANDAIQIDDQFGLTEMARLATQLSSYDPNTLQADTVPGTGVRIQKKDVIRIDRAKAEKVLGKFAATS